MVNKDSQKCHYSNEIYHWR